MSKFEIDGDALKLLNDFVYYANANPSEMAAAMYYDEDEFLRRVRLLAESLG